VIPTARRKVATREYSSFIVCGTPAGGDLWPSGPAPTDASRPTTPNRLILRKPVVDNASCESSIKTLKREEIYANRYRDLEHLRAHVEEFIEQYYNRQRLHSALGYQTPVEFEQRSASLAVDSRLPSSSGLGSELCIRFRQGT